MTRENVYVDFAMRYDRWYRPFATVIGLGPKRTTIRVAETTLEVKHGPFRIDVPLENIKSAKLWPKRPFTWGVHPGGDIWLVNGSRDGIVELGFSRPVTSKSVKLLANDWAEVRTLYLSLVEPEEFIAAVKCNR